MRKLSKQEAIDIIYGCAVVGTGGGGNLQSGLKMIEECYNQGNVVKMAELKELGDDDFVATPYGCGAPRLLADNTEDPYAGLPRLLIGDICLRICSAIRTKWRLFRKIRTSSLWTRK